MGVKRQEEILAEIYDTISEIDSRLWGIHTVLSDPNHPIGSDQEYALEPILNDLRGMIFAFEMANKAAGRLNLECQCIVKGCQNFKHQIPFKGDICAVCYEMITTGNVAPSKSFIREMSNELISMKERFLP